MSFPGNLHRPHWTRIYLTRKETSSQDILFPIIMAPDMSNFIEGNSATWGYDSTHH